MSNCLKCDHCKLDHIGFGNACAYKECPCYECKDTRCGCREYVN